MREPKKVWLPGCEITQICLHSFHFARSIELTHKRLLPVQRLTSRLAFWLTWKHFNGAAVSWPSKCFSETSCFKGAGMFQKCLQHFLFGFFLFVCLFVCFLQPILSQCKIRSKRMFRCFSCSSTPDSNEWVVTRLQQSFMMSWSFESGVLERVKSTKTCKAGGH